MPPPRETVTSSGQPLGQGDPESTDSTEGPEQPAEGTTSDAPPDVQREFRDSSSMEGQETHPSDVESPAVDSELEPDTQAGVSSPSRKRVKRGNPDPWWKFWARPIIDEPAPRLSTPDNSEDESESVKAPDDEIGLVRPEQVPNEVQSEEPSRTLQATERTIAVAQVGGLGPADGIPCRRCGFRNEPTAHFCARCGLDFTQAAGATAKDQDKPADESEGRAPPRRKDWALVGFIALVVGILLFVLLAPQPNPIYNAGASAFRALAYWVAPAAGQSAPYDAIRASSTGFGSPAKALAGNSTATYWASDILPNFGEGSTIVFRLNDNYLLDRMLIQPGIQNGVLDVRALATPQQLTLTFYKVVVPDQQPAPQQESDTAA
ncbi:MAG: hypothetical protein O2815_03960, partial [Actinomycetota bacterium]|nr:hypothetical protein [Actinomycetota bacterium]